jgi:hypothetical protein
MGIFDWLFKKNEKPKPKESAKQITSIQESTPLVTFTVKMERVDPSPTAFDYFTSDIAGSPVRAEVPIEGKAKCERLLNKKTRTVLENDFLHHNYWVNVYYKDERHGYHGINDNWTSSAHNIPELPLLHDWVYSILGKKRPKIDGDIVTIKSWEEKGAIHALGSFASIRVQVSFKPRGSLLNFLLNDESRWEDKASFNTKTGQGYFPFYYSDSQSKIIEWGHRVHEEKRIRPKEA